MKTKLFLLFLIFIYAGNTYAQWSQCSPCGNCDVNTVYEFGNKLFAGTQTNGIYISDNDGNSWSQSNQGITIMNITSFTSDSAGKIFAASASLKVFISADTGLTWQVVNMGGTGSSISSLASYGNYLFAGQKNDGVFVSSNQGISWMESALCCASVLSVNTGPSGLAFAGTASNGVYYASSPYSNWVVYGTGSPHNAVNSIFNYNGKIYAGTPSGVLYNSHPDSAWNAINNGLTTTDVSAINGHNQFLFAATESGGIYTGVNYGDYWVESNLGLTSLNAKDLLVYNGFLYAAFYGGGVWKRNLNELNNISENNSSASISIYPVPANDYLNISTNQNGFYYVHFFDLMGRKHLTTSFEGTDVQLNISNLKQGLYILKIQIGTEYYHFRFIKA